MPPLRLTGRDKLGPANQMLRSERSQRVQLNRPSKAVLCCVRIAHRNASKFGHPGRGPDKFDSIISAWRRRVPTRLGKAQSIYYRPGATLQSSCVVPAARYIVDGQTRLQLDRSVTTTQIRRVDQSQGEQGQDLPHGARHTAPPMHRSISRRVVAAGSCVQSRQRARRF
ncbi:hypothetical protein DAEQUDRAFT_534484 [Daedalea quercina L-15889]|uniref:Uncharacterized protein n=1 Tax=Daedalea quercina L-15889 TaxID=1314783 RepID=A0A165M7I9_9APHY|nr:hypothetical protein DAEQUDRAFT_534484 [Daedalea quercina L-15889]